MQYGNIQEGLTCKDHNCEYYHLFYHFILWLSHVDLDALYKLFIPQVLTETTTTVYGVFSRTYHANISTADATHKLFIEKFRIFWAFSFRLFSSSETLFIWILLDIACADKKSDLEQRAT